MAFAPLAGAYAAIAVVFLALDAIWLTSMADRLYRAEIGPLMLDKVRLAPAAMLYALYFAGIVVFAVQPALEGRRWSVALGLGALLGLVAYGIYDLTNQATLKGWSWKVTMADMAWGTVVTAAAACAGYLAAGWLADRAGR